MKLLKLIALTTMALSTLQLQGCAAAAVIAAVKYGNAKKVEAKQKCYKNYNEYLKIAKQPISLDEYCGDQ